MSKFSLALIFVLFSSFSVSSELGGCGNNEQARVLATLIQQDSKQKRVAIRCNKVLVEAAVAKTRRMAEFGLVVHNLGGSPNSHLRNANYELPDYYGSEYNSNQVEAVAGGYPNAKQVWVAFKNSIAHRSHLLGEHEFYQEQDEIGVAFLKDLSAPHVEYWVVYLTKGKSADQSIPKTFRDIPNKEIFILKKNDETRNKKK